MTAKPVQPEGLVGSIQSEVAAEASPLMLFLIAHARKIAVGIVLFIVAIGAYWAYAWQADGQREADARALGQIMVISDPAMRLEKLEAFAPTAPASVKKAAWFAVMEAATMLENREKAVAAWKTIAELDPSSKHLAAMGMAAALADGGKYKEALESLDAVVGGLTGFDSMNVNSRIVLLAEVLGDYPRALKAAEAIIAQAQNVEESVFWSQKKADIEQKMRASEAGDKAGAAPVKDAEAAPVQDAASAPAATEAPKEPSAAKGE